MGRQAGNAIHGGKRCTHRLGQGTVERVLARHDRRQPLHPVAAAATSGNTRLEWAISARFRSEFKPAFKAWLKQDPPKNPKAAPTPFTLASYRPQELVLAKRLDTKAKKLFDEGRAANQTSDNYVLATIFFAAVLFFAGLSSKISSNRITGATRWRSGHSSSSPESSGSRSCRSIELSVRLGSLTGQLLAQLDRDFQ